MTNKRNLKKAINIICESLFAECIAYSLYNGKADDDTVNSILTSIINVNSDFVRRISHPEPGMAPKEYYKRLIADFDKSANEIVDQICNLG
jgi:hypothetical protein